MSPLVTVGAENGVCSNTTVADGTRVPSRCFRIRINFPWYQQFGLGDVYLSPRSSTALFHVINISSTSCLDSAVSTKSSAYISSHGSSFLIDLVASSITNLKSRGLDVDSWWTPTLVGNYPDSPPANLTWEVEFWYKPITAPTNHLGTISLLKAQVIDCRGTSSKAFSRTTKMW